MCKLFGIIIGVKSGTEFTGCTFCIKVIMESYFFFLNRQYFRYADFSPQFLLPHPSPNKCVHAHTHTHALARAHTYGTPYPVVILHAVM